MLYNTDLEQPGCVQTELHAGQNAQLISGNCQSGKDLEIIKVGLTGCFLKEKQNRKPQQLRLTKKSYTFFFFF